ncbi:MAG TPA: hypothetical protein VGB31_02990 [Myxococcota bacterium]
MFNPDKALEQQPKRRAGEPRQLRRCGCTVLFAAPGAPDARNAWRRKEREYRVRHGLIGSRSEKPIPPEDRETIFEEVIAEAIAKGWSDVVDSEVKAIPFSPAMFLKFMREIDVFRLDVLEHVGEDELELAEEREVLEGNS